MLAVSNEEWKKHTESFWPNENGEDTINSFTIVCMLLLYVSRWLPIIAEIYFHFEDYYNIKD